MTLQIRELSPALQKVAREQLFEEPEKIAEMVQIIRDWIAKSPHLKARTDDQFLVTFLRCCKYSIERTKQKIDQFYTLRTHMPEWLQNRDPQKLRIREILRGGMMLPLPKTVDEGTSRIILGLPGDLDPNIYPIDEVFKVMFMCGDLMMEEDDQMIVAGQVNIVDLKKANLAHFLHFTPTMMKKMTTLMEQGSPFRLKAIHYVNVPPFFEKFFNMIRSFLNEKMRARLHIHGGDMTSLHEIIPKSVLPIEYGGENGSIDEIAQYWEEKIFANRQLLIDLTTKYGVDEKKRIGKPKNPETLFGIDGSFRQLQFD